MKRRTRHVAWLGILAALLAATPAVAEKKVPERPEIEARYTWDLEAMYPNPAALEADFTKVEDMIKQLAALKGTLGRSPQDLLAALTLRDECSVQLEKVFAYCMMLRDQDTRVSDSQALYARAETLSTGYDEATSWITPELLSLSSDTLQSWCDQGAKLAVYRHYFDDVLRRKPHTLDAAGEELLAMAGQMSMAPGQIFGMLTNADLKFPTIKDEKGEDVELSPGRYYAFLYSADRRVRRDSTIGFHETFAAIGNTLATSLSYQMQRDWYFARARKYGTCIEAALDDDNIPVAVYDNLISTIHKSLPVLHRYIELKKRVLKLDEVHAHDLYAPLTAEVQRTIPYEEAVTTITDGLAPLGREYLEPMKKGFDSRWIDVKETQGKRSGAYSMGPYLSHPYMLLNYYETHNDQSTVAHEMGHSMHSWFTQHNQPMVYGDYSIFCAEVASTCNEILLNDYLLKNTKDPKEKAYLINQQLENIRTTVFRQTLFAEFEREVHLRTEKGEPLTFESLSKLYHDLRQKYYGPSFVIDEAVDAEWARIPHFYRSFYVYKYATSFSAAANIGTRILAGEPGAVDGYLKFLKAGSSDYPIEVLKLAGVDMTGPKPIEDVMALFGRLLDELEPLL